MILCDTNILSTLGLSLIVTLPLIFKRLGLVGNPWISATSATLILAEIAVMLGDDILAEDDIGALAVIADSIKNRLPPPIKKSPLEDIVPLAVIGEDIFKLAPVKLLFSLNSVTVLKDAVEIKLDTVIALEPVSKVKPSVPPDLPSLLNINCPFF